MESFKFGKILVYSKNDGSEEKQNRLCDFEEQVVKTSDFEVEYTDCLEDFSNAVQYHQDIVAVFMEYCADCKDKFVEVLKSIRKTNKQLPITVFSTKGIDDLSVAEFEEVTDTAMLYEDSIEFLTGRVVGHAKAYLDIIVSPFMKTMIEYASSYKYAWHTPGHMGGAAFRKNPPGQFFYNYYGEHVFRTDLSISVPDMGSLLDHNGPIGESEKYASKVFGSDLTYYVCNGTSSVNQIIWRSRVTRGDLAFVDRNCHKSLNYAMVITEATPTYMVPRRNGLGIIGPVKLEEFTADYIKKAVAKNPLVPADKKGEKIKMSTLTNSTYDGLCYNVNKIKDQLTDNVENMHFDEAWYSYAKFNPIYKEHFAMTADDENTKAHPPIYASHSTHKLMAAFSQGSMVHVKNGTSVKIDPETFNEAFMMYSSTSPNYPMIASLDVSAKMMDFNGEQLINNIIVGAVELRKEITRLYNEETKKGGWFFRVWQPTTTVYNGKKVDFADAPTEFLAEDQKTWILNKEDKWHGFGDIEDDYVMLDPIKITIKMPGRNADGTMEKMGIPAHIVSGYLQKYGIVAEKTDYYSFLILNSVGVTRGQQKALLSGLAHFKKLYDDNALLSDVFPELVEQFPETYTGVGLKDHCQAMHEYIKESHMMDMMAQAYQTIPTPQYSPAEAARRVFQGKTEKVMLDEMRNRTAAVMIVPYPPGIPMVMGGEKVQGDSEAIVDYLLAREKFEEKFLGYFGDIHGVEAIEVDGKRKFQVMVLKED